MVAKLTVGTDGRVTDCHGTTQSSGNSDLDSTDLPGIAKSRVRFTPAKDDAAGNPIAS